jgi:iron-sulfur cluster assembly protein
MSDQNVQNINDIRLTRSAALFIQKSIAADPIVKGIRVGVKTSGCSGRSYYLEPAQASDDADQVFHCHGVSIFVNQESFPYLKGVEIDCVQEGLGEYLKFNNPNVKGACGCGESFSVE